MRRRRLDSSGVDAGGESGGEPTLTRKWRGVSTTREKGVSTDTLPFSAVAVRVCRPRPDDPNRASGEGEDGSDPPVFTAGAVRRRGACQPRRPRQCQHAPPPSGGSLPSSCIPAGRLPGPRAGRTTRRTERRDA